MTTDRRNFLKNAAQLGALSLFPFPILAEKNKERNPIPPLDFSNAAADDDNFWNVLRMQFPLSNTRVYFNNGTMGPSPFPVIDALHQKMMQVDTTGEYGGWED